jgi:hypothetical protein
MRGAARRTDGRDRANVANLFLGKHGGLRGSNPLTPERPANVVRRHASHAGDVMSLLAVLGLPKVLAQVAAPPDTKELARWPAEAHGAWKKLDMAGRSAVLVQMAALYGVDFARSFADFAKKGNTRLESADFVPALPTQTPEAMKKRGYRLAQKGGTADTGQEWWVHPSGHQIYLQRELTPRVPSAPAAPGPVPPVKIPPRVIEPPGQCTEGDKQLLEMTLKWLKDALTEAETRQQTLDKDKAALDKLNITTPQFAKAYKAYADLLAEDAKWIQDLLDSAEQALEALKNSGCDLSELNSDVQSLRDDGIGFDAAKDLFDHDLRKPLNVDIKGDDDGPDDDE